MLLPGYGECKTKDCGQHGACSWYGMNGAFLSRPCLLLFCFVFPSLWQTICYILKYCLTGSLNLKQIKHDECDEIKWRDSMTAEAEVKENHKFTEYKLVSLPVETVHHMWLPPKLSAISCFLSRLLSVKNGFLLSAGSSITRTDSAGSLLSCTTVSTGSERLRTVSVEAKYDSLSRQEAKIGGLVYTLYSLTTVPEQRRLS